MELTPTQAVRLADASYLGLQQSNVAAILKQTALADMFDPEQSSLIAGSSGAGWRATSAFALVLRGRGAWQGQYCVAVRGTVTFADVLSDLVAAIEPGPGGHPVHAGFNRVSKSLSPGVMAALRNKNPSRIHCVGHSLGGAIANLVAAQLDATVGGSTLYTFGSPRVGPGIFAEGLTWSLGTNAIHRAFSMRDAVPMVPIFPFQHAPFRSEGALVGPTGGFVAISAHLLRSYGPAVEGQTWRGLKTRARDTPMSVDQLLDSAAEAVRFPGGALALHLLGRVMGALLASVDMVAGTAVTASLTLCDRLAFMLIQCARVSVEMAQRVSRFVEYVMRFLGRPVIQGVSLTAQFVRCILQLLMAKISGIARAALTKN